jgi:cyanate permease
MALAMGASMIAPMAENHSTPRRLAALGMVALLGLIGWIADIPREPMAVMLMLVGVPAVTIALTERLELLPPICRPFLRLGNFGKFAGRVLYPGWASGVVFTGLLLAAIIGVYFPRPDPTTGFADTMDTVFLMVSIGTLLLPALIMRAFFRRAGNPLGVYILIGVLLFVVAVSLGMIMAETEKDDYVWFLSWIPPVQLDVMDHLHRTQVPSGSLVDLTPVLKVGKISSAIYFVLLLLIALRNFSSIREVEQEAEGHAANPS